MKKHSIIFSLVLITISLTTFGFMSWNITDNSTKKSLTNTKVTCQGPVQQELVPDFVYSIGSRFGAIKKSEIDQMTSVDHLLRVIPNRKIVSYKLVTITILNDIHQTGSREIGNSNILNEAQIKLLR